MNNLTAIFREVVTTTGGKNQLAMTAQLTTQSQAITEALLTALNTEEDGQERVLAMIENPDVLVNEVAGYIQTANIDAEYLLGIEREDAIKMLKSQQSKRSRAKSAANTLNGFKTMMTAAVAEELIRITHDISRTANAGARGTTELILTDEMIEAYTNDQPLLVKAIRNVQSKKSIMKRKAGFDENSEEYQQLLGYEASLKALRVTGGGVDTKTAAKAKKAEEVEHLLADIDPSKMKKDELAKALEEMKSMMLSDLR